MKEDFFLVFLTLSPMAYKYCVFAARCTVTTFTFHYFPFVCLLLWMPGEYGSLLVQPGTKTVCNMFFNLQVELTYLNKHLVSSEFCFRKIGSKSVPDTSLPNIL
jgi:hypothetical protein